MSVKLPDVPDAEGGTRRIAALAAEQRIENPVMRARNAVQQDGIAYVPLELSGLGSYAQIYTFFDRLRRLPRPVEVETVSISPDGTARFRFAAVLRLHYFAVDTIVSDRESLAFDEALQWDLLRTKARTAAELRERTGQPLALLEAFDPGRVALSLAVMGREFHFRGTQVMPGLDLRRQVTALGGDVARYEITTVGRCQSFDLSGRAAARRSDATDSVDAWAMRAALFDTQRQPCPVK